jgi:hypothetical protein
MSEALPISASQTLFTGTMQYFNPAHFTSASFCNIASSVGAVVINDEQTGVRQDIAQLRQQTSDVLAFVISGQHNSNEHRFLL